MEQLLQQLLFSQQHSALLFVLVFFTGVLTSLTPCVYPMIPITVSVVTQQATHAKQRVRFTFIYVLGLALTYSLLGVLAASSGHLFGSVATHPMMLFSAGVFCLLMAASLLDWIKMPQLSVRVSASSRVRSLNVFVTGLLSGLVMAPCTSPVLGMLLMFVASTQSPLLGFSFLFLFALGMSALLLLIGCSTHFLSRLPKSGRWMLVVKYLLALAMVGVALMFFLQINS